MRVFTDLANFAELKSATYKLRSHFWVHIQFLLGLTSGGASGQRAARMRMMNGVVFLPEAVLAMSAMSTAVPYEECTLTLGPGPNMAPIR